MTAGLFEVVAGVGTGDALDLGAVARFHGQVAHDDDEVGVADGRGTGRLRRPGLGGPVGQDFTGSRLPAPLRAIHIAAVADTDDLDDEPVVEHLIDDPVITHPHPVSALLTGKRDASRWPRILGQKIDRSPHPLLLLAGQRGNRLGRTSGDINPIRRHVRPRSALTSAHGM
jgi:hypothetical protein